MRSVETAADVFTEQRVLASRKDRSRGRRSGALAGKSAFRPVTPGAGVQTCGGPMGRGAALLSEGRKCRPTVDLLCHGSPTRVTRVTMMFSLCG